MRRSMVALIDKGEPQEAHPAYWAPFVVVGEGSTPPTPQALKAAPSVAKGTARKARSGEQRIGQWNLEAAIVLVIRQGRPPPPRCEPAR